MLLIYCIKISQFIKCNLHIFLCPKKQLQGLEKGFLRKEKQVLRRAQHVMKNGQYCSRCTQCNASSCGGNVEDSSLEGSPGLFSPSLCSLLHSKAWQRPLRVTVSDNPLPSLWAAVPLSRGPLLAEAGKPWSALGAPCSAVLWVLVGISSSGPCGWL